MNNVRNIAPPVLPVPQSEYSIVQQNVTNSALQQFGVRTSNAINQLLQQATPKNATYAKEFTFAAGDRVIYRVSLTGDINISAPQSATDGDVVVLWLYAGGASSRTATLNSSIVVPSTITGATPLTIASGKKAVYTVCYDGTLNNGQWELVSFQNGY